VRRDWGRIAAYEICRQWHLDGDEVCRVGGPGRRCPKVVDPYTRRTGRHGADRCEENELKRVNDGDGFGE